MLAESSSSPCLFVFLFFLKIVTCAEEAEPEESEEPFVAPPGLVIPPDVELVSRKPKHTYLHREFKPGNIFTHFSVRKTEAFG